MNCSTKSGTTVNRHLGINEMFALLERLKGILQDFAAREDKLGGELHTRINAENKAHEAAIEKHSAELAECLAGAEMLFESEKKNRQGKFEKRKARISQALLLTTNQVMEGNDRSGRRKQSLQHGAQDAERNRDADLTSIAVKLEDFRARLAEKYAAFEPLENAARSAFRGYGAFRRLLSPQQTWPDAALPKDEKLLFEELQRLETKTRDELKRFEKIPLPRLFKFLPMWLLTILLLLAFGVAVPLLHQPGNGSSFYGKAGVALAMIWVVLFVIHQLGKRQGAPSAGTIASHLARARRLHDGSLEQADLQYVQEQERIQKEYETTSRTLSQQWKLFQKEAMDTRGTRAQKVDEKGARTMLRHELSHRARLRQIEGKHAENVARLQQDAEARARELTTVHAEKMVRLESEQQTRWQALEMEWKDSIQPIHAAITAANTTANTAADELFPNWQSPAWKNWTPPSEFKNVAKFGRADVDATKLADALPKDKRLALPFPASFSVPLLLKYPAQGSILFETARTGGDEAIGAINNIIFRLLSTHPPGKLSFTIFDPVGLGQNFAGLMHLADYEESLINSRIWTQSSQLEEKLAELNEHMEKVIQMYLRNEYETIAEYNAQAGTIAEKYHLLVIADFPVNFTETAARRLINIATSGARCGVFTLIHWDKRHALPSGFVADELHQKTASASPAPKPPSRLEGKQPSGTRLVLDVPPSPDFVTDFLHQVGESGKDSNRVEVPFEQVAPPPDKLWTEETTEELTVPIGRSGATKLQMLAIGKGTRQHALVAGKTGSGKSTLFHVVITNLALWCSPEEVEFYLVDFKKGVEFKCYGNRRLPHAKVVAIESDREFGLSVLQRVDEELRRRGDLFRKLGVQDVAGYKRAGGSEPMPRSLLIIDEFQEFFTEEDQCLAIRRQFLLDRIVRQGRAFGIHVLLGSQTLGGAYTLARATIGQMVIRIALMCNEADAYLIMDQDNPAPRLLTRPGEGIYNDAAGSYFEGNSPFQTVWLPEEVRDNFLARIRARADQSEKKYPGPFVFEGNAAADVKENLLLQSLLQAKSLPARRRGGASG